MRESNISLEWFKGTLKDSIKEVFEKKIDSLFENPINDLEVKDFTVVNKEKLYKKLKLVGNVITLVKKDGSILCKPEATASDYYRIQNALTEEEIVNILTTDESRKERELQAREVAKFNIIRDNLKRLGSTGDFTISEKTVFLKGTNRSLPSLLVEKFIEVISKYEELKKKDFREALKNDYEYQGLKRFFMWCCLNPRAEVANDLYDFLSRNSFRITKQGFFIALRNVVTVGSENNELVHFVSNSYNKIKAVWKKNPKDYCVIDNAGNYSLQKFAENKDYAGTNLGNLQDLYLDLPNLSENRFTDAHTRTFDIRVGRVVNMPMEDCNWNTADCGHAGLHFTSDEIHYVGCGDTSVLILINPMKVVGIGSHKGRCYEYLPIMTVPRDEATQILHDGDFDTYQLDEGYAINELYSLAERVKEGFVKETSKHEFNLPSISNVEIDNIVLSLNEMGDTIKNRVSNVE